MMFGAVALMMAASLVFTGCRDEEGSADVNISWAIMETPLLFWELMTVMIFMPVISAQ